MPDRSPTVPYLPFLDGPPSFAPKLKPIEVKDWLLPDTEKDLWLPEKLKLMKNHRSETVAGDVDGAAAHEAAHLVQESTGEWPTEDWPSVLEMAASTVSDDLCVIEQYNRENWRLSAGVLAAPTYWRLQERIGLDLGGLHGEVPGGDPGLARRIRRVFSAIRPGVILERFNWTVQLTSARYTPERPKLSNAEPKDLHLRVERQTVRKLPSSEAVLFTIRICTDPLLPILNDGETREAFEDAWLLAPKPVRTYKGWDQLEQLVKDACRRSAQAAL